MISQLLLSLVAFSFVVMLWVFFFFIFDAEVLNGYFATKLRKRFDVESLK